MLQDIFTIIKGDRHFVSGHADKGFVKPDARSAILQSVKATVPAGLAIPMRHARLKVTQAP